MIPITIGPDGLGREKNPFLNKGYVTRVCGCWSYQLKELNNLLTELQKL